MLITEYYDNLPIANVIARSSVTLFLNSFKSLDVSSPTLETLLLFHISSILQFDLSDSGKYCNCVTWKIVGISLVYQCLTLANVLSELA